MDEYVAIESLIVGTIESETEASGEYEEEGEGEEGAIVTVRIVSTAENVDIEGNSRVALVPIGEELIKLLVTFTLY